jgi:hypothetical protein
MWYFFGYSSYGTYYKASASDYTIVSFPFENLTYTLNSGRIDLQVMALIGNEIPSHEQNGRVYVFDGVISDWSNTQTITIIESNNSPTPTSTPPTDRNPPHLDPTYYLIPVSVIVAIFIVLSVLLFIRHRKSPKSNQ